MKVAVFGNGCSLRATIPPVGKYDFIAVCNGGFFLRWLYPEIQLAGFCDLKAYEYHFWVKSSPLLFYYNALLSVPVIVNFHNQPHMYPEEKRFAIRDNKNTGLHMIREMLIRFPNQQIDCYGFDFEEADLAIQFQQGQGATMRAEFEEEGLFNNTLINFI